MVHKMRRESLELLENLEKTLYDNAQVAFSRIFATFAEEEIYGVALYTSDEHLYVCPTCFTEKGLDEVAQRYYKKEGYSALLSFEEMREKLRWSPCDSPRHLAFQDCLKEADQIVDSAGYIIYGPDTMGEFASKEDEMEGDAMYYAIPEVFVKVLQRLDNEGVFGVGEAREKILVNIFKGEQSTEENLNFARRLNPASVYARYAAENSN